MSYIKQRMTGFTLIAALLAGLLLPLQPEAVHAETEIVTGIEFDNGSPAHLYVDHEDKQVKVLATIQGQTTKKDVTNQAYWASSKPSVVTVDKGLLEPKSQGTAKITAKYEGRTLTLDVTVDYLFQAVRLDKTGTLSVDLSAKEIQLKADAVEQDNSTFDVTDEAYWSSSNTSAATVSDGLVKLVAEGKATITVKYKGRTDTVTFEISSPYRSIAIVSPDDNEFLVGESGAELRAMATLPNNTENNVTNEVTWTSSNEQVVKVEKGKLTLLSEGLAVITVNQYGRSAKYEIIVRLPYRALTVTPNKPLYLFRTDEPVKLKAEVANDFASRTDVTADAEWTTSDPLVATVEDGSVKPRGVGEAAITVEYKGLSKSVPVMVMPLVEGLTIAKNEMTLFKDEVKSLPEVTGLDLNGEKITFNEIVEWETSNSAVVAIENGKLQAKKPGEAVVTMRLRGFADTLKVTVREKVLALLPDEKTVTLVKGQTIARPKVKAIFEDGAERDISDDIEWTVSSPNLLLSGGTMKGLLPAKVSLKGTYLNKEFVVSVTIEDKITNITLEPKAVVLNPGSSKTIKAEGLDSNKKKVSIARDVEWVSSNPAVAAVNGTSIKGVAKGTAVITGEYQGNTLQITVTVEPKLLKVVLSDKTVKLTSGQSVSAKLTAYYSDGSTADVTDKALWTSSNISIAKVSGGKISAVKKGSATIKAAFGGKSASLRTTVTQ
ncbi:Ig-like domain-containing protein [Paenibacillus thermotolerans]|uniref:Ig-like domain-containing protein n=1 Tax=Paenibacillus thermotolerans TaxID=3027807 RepID=UPI0023688095|nr:MULTISPECIES: Ig-like domain-containing protein [unclassified Paenibacillus]